MIGGGAFFRSSQYEGQLNDRQILAEFSGDIGYFIIDKFTIGLKPSYDRTETKGSSNVIVSSYGLGPFVRYYFLPSDKYVDIFSELSYQYGITKTNQSSSSVNSNKISGIVGCSAFFNTSVGVEFTLGYSSYMYANNSAKVKSIIAGIGFQFYLEK